MVSLRCRDRLVPSGGINEGYLTTSIPVPCLSLPSRRYCRVVPASDGYAASEWVPTGSVTVRVPGKVNLYLGVGDCRDDGYHELATIFLAIDLCDHLTITRSVETGSRVGGSCLTRSPSPCAQGEGSRLLLDLVPPLPLRWARGWGEGLRGEGV